MVPTTSGPSLIVFGPQTELSSRDSIDQLRQEPNQNPQLSHVLHAAKYGAELWRPLANFDPTLNHIPGAKLLAELQEWVIRDGPLPSYNFNTFRLPVTVLLEIAQYVRYLKQLNVVSPHHVPLEGVQTGGILGFCVGFFSAIAVATSETEAEIAFTAAAVFRLAVIIDAYVDNNQFGVYIMHHRCRIVLHINWKAQTLPIIVGGLPSKKNSAAYSFRDWDALPEPSFDEIVRVSPRAKILGGKYRTPTFFIHGTNDDLIPWQQSQGTYNALLEAGVPAGLALIEGAPHIFDLSSNPESEGWKAPIQGYGFIRNYV
ncbi:Acyl transferase/acyl hydrolase/lysophospholipase [Penicillium cf. griseofulvum]|uniref:Acyl transferase/acyl hydrolase/lysophospholipase n=1 Tax=Penicillium cf. griseofulvum TaxID=2972120 RepID=A0A9W9IWQ7_9EURO|nr:Acyl transferase/acyl hydrolase/lysophospholipase [Penicillium cf. griseofulvum]